MDFEMSEDGRMEDGKKKSNQHGARRSGDALSGCWAPTGNKGENVIYLLC